MGEYVVVRREPSIQYDHNAIRIDNVQCQLICHIGRDLAAILTPLMDSRELVVEGAQSGTKNDFECPIGLKMFGMMSYPKKWTFRRGHLRIHRAVSSSTGFLRKHTDNDTIPHCASDR